MSKEAIEATTQKIMKYLIFKGCEIEFSLDWLIENHDRTWCIIDAGNWLAIGKLINKGWNVIRCPAEHQDLCELAEDISYNYEEYLTIPEDVRGF